MAKSSTGWSTSAMRNIANKSAKHYSRGSWSSTMPHVIVKLWPGKSEQQKARLAEKITQDVMDVLQYGEESVSVAMEEITAKDWAEKVYKPDILNNAKRLYKKPGYDLDDL